MRFDAGAAERACGATRRRVVSPRRASAFDLEKWTENGGGQRGAGEVGEQVRVDRYKACIHEQYITYNQNKTPILGCLGMLETRALVPRSHRNRR